VSLWWPCVLVFELGLIIEFRLGIVLGMSSENGESRRIWGVDDTLCKVVKCSLEVIYTMWVLRNGFELD